jgi:C_GCAxxG_C_C family probable redox protein
MGEAEKATEFFMDGWNCSQSVLAAFHEEAGLTREAAFNLGRPYGGGIARQAKVCGAVNGAVLALGCLCAKGESEKEARGTVYTAVNELFRRFDERFGSCDCKGLLDFDISKPEEHKQAVEGNVFKTVCPDFVQFAVDTVKDLK